MNILAFIESGILETYCLGFCTPEEVIEIKNLSAIHPGIKQEINRLRQLFEEQLHTHAITPSPSVKTAVMQSVYKQQSLVDYRYAPLIDENCETTQLEKWITLHGIKAPVEEFENLVITELLSTDRVINFIAAAKTGHEQEVHEDFIEYLYVIEGSCTMDFNGEEKSYSRGDIIAIPPKVHHTAVVTSKKPMLALVQRQILV